MVYHSDFYEVRFRVDPDSLGELSKDEAEVASKLSAMTPEQKARVLAALYTLARVESESAKPIEWDAETLQPIYKYAYGKAYPYASGPRPKKCKP